MSASKSGSRWARRPRSPSATPSSARALHRARKRIGLFVGGGSRCLEQDFGAELALEQELRRLAGMRDDGRQKVAARRSLFTALRELLGQPSEDQQIGLGMGGSHRWAGLLGRGGGQRGGDKGGLTGSHAPIGRAKFMGPPAAARALTEVFENLKRAA